MNNELTIMKRLLTSGLAALALGLAVAPIAKASPDDDAFLQVIAEHGYSDLNGGPLSGYIHLGHQVCDDLDIRGLTLMEEVRHIQHWNGSYISVGNVAYFIGAAHAAYCPWVTL